MKFLVCFTLGLSTHTRTHTLFLSIILAKQFHCEHFHAKFANETWNHLFCLLGFDFGFCALELVHNRKQCVSNSSILSHEVDKYILLYNIYYLFVDLFVWEYSRFTGTTAELSDLSKHTIWVEGTLSKENVAFDRFFPVIYWFSTILVALYMQKRKRNGLKIYSV